MESQTVWTRRGIFLLMLAALLLPLLLNQRFPERAGPKVQNCFDAIESLPRGSRILISLDYDPASEAELAPMMAAVIRHCCEKQHTLYLMTLWERGPITLEKAQDLIRREYPGKQPGRDYVNFGFKPGRQAAIRNAMILLRQDFAADARGLSVDDDRMPATRAIQSFRDMHLLVCIGSGDPGPREWIQFAAAQYQKKIIVGTPGVQAPTLFPYYPAPLSGMITAIKGAAEYEQLLLVRYPHLTAIQGTSEGLRLMAPQLTAHVLIVILILVGNSLQLLNLRFGRNRRHPA